MRRTTTVGSPPERTITRAAMRAGGGRLPAAVSAWRPAAAEGAGRFRVYVNQTPTAGGSLPADPTLHLGREIADGGLVEGVAPLPLIVTVDDFAGFAENDPRRLRIEVDYGERYEAQYHDPANFPPELTMPQGSTLGLYVGFISGHSLRGTGPDGAPVLTPANPTVDNTVTVTVSDGQQTRQLAFRARLYHPDLYYTDRTKSVCYPAAPETNRRGIVYFARDGDFTGALPERRETTTQAGIYHYHKPDGIIDQTVWAGNQTRRGGPKFPFDDRDIGCIDIRLKGGERYFPDREINPPGSNSRLSSWGSGQAILDPERIRRWVGRPAVIRLNGNGTEGLRLDNLSFECSDFTPTSRERREWWNILAYTGRRGARFGENTGKTTKGLNGEVVTNDKGVYAQVIGDDGTALTVRQVVDAPDPNADAARPAAFSDGDTLRGMRTGTTATFVALGSRQDRTVRWPAVGIRVLGMRSLCVDRCQFTGASSAIAEMGIDSVLSDSWIRNWADYGFYGGSGSYRSIAISGCAFTQPLGYLSQPRDFGAAVAGAREEWNIVRLDDPSRPMENAPAHNAHRFARLLMGAYHRNKVHTYGGHGAFHQPAFRLITRGSEAPDRFYCVVHGNAISGGRIAVNFGTANPKVVPYTARAVLVEANHLLAHDTAERSLVTVNYSGTTVRNNLVQYPARIDFGEKACIFVQMYDRRDYRERFGVDPDRRSKDVTVEFNTFVFEASNARAVPDVGAQDRDLRGHPVTWANNIYAIDASKVLSISADVAAINDAPATDFEADWRPRPTSHGYRSAEGRIAWTDARGNDRPDTDASRGAFEPAKS